jgi:hypothetical protein
MSEPKPIDDGGSAFPSDGLLEEGPFARREGMSLRDYFAGKCVGAVFTVTSGTAHPGVNGENLMPVVAKVSYALADAMIAARKEGA